MQAPILKAQVTETGAEISCSIDETNRIRAMLGMKPLRIGDEEANEKEVAAREAHKEQITAKVKQLELAELEERLAKAKRQRLLHAKLKGGGLGSRLKGEKGMNSAADWVKRSRIRETQETLMATKREALLAAQDELSSDEEEKPSAYDAAALKGLNVAHSATELGEGTTILTLRDRGVLDDDDTDVLENVNMACDNRTKEMNEEKEKAAKPVYTGEESDVFDPSARNADASKLKILQQYDEKKKKEAGMVLDGRSFVSADELQKAVALRKVEEAKKGLRKGEVLMSLETAKKEISDYYKPSEVIAFKRPKKKLRKKKRRKTKKVSIADMLEANPQPGLEKSGRSRGKGSLTERAKQQKRQEATAAASYKLALQRARIATAAVIANDADDDFLVRSVERARQMAREKKSLLTSVSDQMTKHAARGRIEDDAKKVAAAAAAAAEEDTRKKDRSIVFTSTTEFTQRLRARMESKKKTREALRRKKAALAKPEAAEDDMDIEGGMAEDEEASKADDDESSWATVSAKGGNAQKKPRAAARVPQSSADFITAEPLVSSGMASTLALLGRTGDLKAKVATAGRAKDEKMDQGKPEDRVKIEYKDEWGRHLTPKEAFRQLSYKFHGRKPGRKKQERVLRKLREDLQVNAMDMNDTPLGVMRAMHRKQMQSHQAHVVLRGAEASGKLSKKGARR